MKYVFKKMITGIWFLLWLFICILITSPVWLLLFIYDLGNPRDDKDRVSNFIVKMCKIGGLNLD